MCKNFKGGKYACSWSTEGYRVEIIFDDDEDDKEEYEIVGSREADPVNNKISNESPIAKAILNKKVGDVAEVSSPDGVFTVKIMNIA